VLQHGDAGAWALAVGRVFEDSASERMGQAAWVPLSERFSPENSDFGERVS
jgi:hypothetical protein